MANWIPITIATLYEAKVAALIDAASTAAKAVAQSDRVPGLIQEAVDEVRRKVGSCKTNQVDSDETKIPKGLRGITITLIIAKLKNAIEQDMTEDERRAVARAYTDLDRVASCADVVEQPDAPVQPEVQGGPAVQLIRPGINPDRCGLDSLI